MTEIQRTEPADMFDLDGSIHIVDQLVRAQRNRDRAALLLKVPDTIIVTHGGELVAACVKVFPQVEGFVAARSAALSAVRDAHGLLPFALADQVEGFRVAFSRMAAGAPAAPLVGPDEC